MAAYVLHLAILAGIYIILTVSINLIIGYAGQVSLGHAAFYGIGAYASALVSLHWHFPFPAAALVALLVAGLCGFALGLPTLRLKEDYLAIVTLGFGVIVDLVFLNLEITGGPDGLPGIPPPSFFGAELPGALDLPDSGGRHRAAGPGSDLPPGGFLSWPGPEGHPGPRDHRPGHGDQHPGL